MKFAYRKEFVTEPLAQAVRRRGWEVIETDTPGEDVIDGKADIALTSTLDYARHLGHVDYALVPGFGIMTSGFANIAAIVFNKGLSTISSLAVRNADAPETILAKIALSEKHHIDPKIITASPSASTDEMLELADGAFLVGDDAVFSAGKYPSQLDLTDEWEDMTEAPLPYMLAWGQVEHVPQGALDDLQSAREQAILSLADYTSQEGSVQAQTFYERYLRGNIHYSLTPDDEDALNAFFQYAFFHGYIRDIPTIKYLPDGELPGGVPPIQIESKEETGTTGDSQGTTTGTQNNPT